MDGAEMAAASTATYRHRGVTMSSTIQFGEIEPLPPSDGPRYWTFSHEAGTYVWSDILGEPVPIVRRHRIAKEYAPTSEMGK